MERPSQRRSRTRSRTALDAIISANTTEVGLGCSAGDATIDWDAIR